MGQPKGLCIADDDQRPLLARIVDLHDAAGHPTTVVTVADLVDSYEAGLDDRRVSWLILEAGGDTARTVLAGVRALACRTTHLWLHPVDLPRVAPATLELLAELSEQHPDSVIIPEYDGVPGHPVVLPVRPIEAPWPADAPGPMRVLLNEGPCPVISVACEDPGIIDDLDTPEDLGGVEDS